MRTLLLFVLISGYFHVVSQISFVELAALDDISISAVLRSSSGEYFLQTTNDLKGIYTSPDGETWTRNTLPVNHPLTDIRTLSDGTPVLMREDGSHLVRRDGSWHEINPTFGGQATTFIKDDTLFAFQENVFSYSVDKGKTFEDLFVIAENINDYELRFWKVGQSYVLAHEVGATGYLSVFRDNGERVLFHTLTHHANQFTLHACGQILVTHFNAYTLLDVEQLNITSGHSSDIHPDFENEIFSVNGNYYIRIDETVYQSDGCDFVWEEYAMHPLIGSGHQLWITQQAGVMLYEYKGDSFIDHVAGSGAWNKIFPDITSAHILDVDESLYQSHQVALTPNALFTKTVAETHWTENDSLPVELSQVQYAPDGDLYINRGRDILYSRNNGLTFQVIPTPEEIPGFFEYAMEVPADDVIFLHSRLFGSDFVSINNGADWIPFSFGFFLDPPIVKLAGNSLYLADISSPDYTVHRIHLGTQETESVTIGTFVAWDLHGFAISDDGTIYFQGRDLSGEHPEGLFRYRFGTGLEYVGYFPELEDSHIFTFSGQELLVVLENKSFVFDGTNFHPTQHTGIPAGGSKKYFLAANQHLYVILDNRRIFRSTRALTHPQVIHGNVYHHKKQDCLVDSAETGLSHWSVKVENPDYMAVHITNTLGAFRFRVPEGEYTVSCQPLSNHWGLCEDVYQVTVEEEHSEVRQDFLAQAVSHCAELELDFSTPFLRRCFENYYSVRARNTGPRETSNTTLVLRLDPFFDSVTATLPFVQLDNDFYEFDLGVLDVNEEVFFRISFVLSCDAELGTEHCVSGRLFDEFVCGGDRSEARECQENIGAYDPNDKRAFNEDGEATDRVEKEEYIYYHIRFQNTGTDTAFNVRITDPLSPVLDINTLEMLSASHPYTYSITQGPALLVRFDHILLPDSNRNEPASHGFFKFRIKPYASYNYGTMIPNKADIFFDFNEAVVTPDANLTILPAVGIKEAKNLVVFDLYPNPAEHFLGLRMSEADRNRIDVFEIVDDLGRTVLASAGSGPSGIDVRHLPPGLYTVVLKEKGFVIGVKMFLKS